ncbi:MAG: hypothetical protein HC852_21890 [Acaryochloridaceae cyanobacterium RU_4_10]|nr:hypothetical protein [Acaryochloridaceae cyanobacterium RU_4_10]
MSHYREATGQIFRDPRPGAEQSLLGGDEWSVLEDICNSDPMHLVVHQRNSA